MQERGINTEDPGEHTRGYCTANNGHRGHHKYSRREASVCLLHRKDNTRKRRTGSYSKAGTSTAGHIVSFPSAIFLSEDSGNTLTHSGTHLHAGALVTERYARNISKHRREEEHE